MKMKNFFTLLFLLYLGFRSFAQDTQSIKGQVLQLGDSTPVYNAHIYFVKSAIGTTTNGEGFFVFHFLEDKKNSNIQISCIGYKPHFVEPSDFVNEPLVIYLEEDQVLLSQVVVTPIDPKNIIEKAIDNIKQNYPQEKINKTVYYKESFDQNGTPIRFLEVVATIVSDGFSNSRQNPDKYDLFVEQKRPGFNYDSAFEGGNGIGVLHWLLWIEKYLSKKQLRKLSLSYEGKFYFREHEVYKIKIKTPDENRPATLMYITVDNFAIVAVRESFINAKRNAPDEKQQYRFLAFDLYVDFLQLDDGNWYIHSIDDFRKSISYDGTITKTERSIRVTSVETGRGDINEKNKILKETDLYKYPIKYDPDFWSYYNAPPETKEELKAKKDFTE